MLEKMDAILTRFHISKDKLLAFVFSLIFVCFSLIDTNYWHGILGHSILILALFIVLLLITVLMMYAGIIVIKSLVEVSVGLTLIIFLAQTYCGPEVIRTVNSDQALAVLISLGLLYVGYDFIFKIFHAIQNHKEKLKKISWGWQEKGMYLLGVVFVFGFIILVYQVINPIMQSLCVYR